MTGGMVAANRDELLVNPATFRSFSPEAHPTELIGVPAAAILKAYGTWQSVPNQVSATYTTSLGAVWVELRALRDEHALEWFVLVSIPENDILGPIVASRKKVVMLAATQMDFSALNNGYLNEEARVSEIATMQKVFKNMMEKFAAAIKASRALNSNQIGSKNQQKVLTSTGHGGNSNTPIMNSRALPAREI
ncbi:hypothetical protein HDU89_008925 [Geranomyces variabilis]|nr:hypothetical protein HDU89_008925 [Geranomyces variabilis]